MTTFQTCKNTSDIIQLHPAQQLYLKPITQLHISVQLPHKKMGKSISNLEVMEQLRFIVKPDTFCSLKVISTNVEFLRFEAEMDDKNKLQKTTEKLNESKIKLREFPELLKLRANESKPYFPKRYEWDTFFRDAENMNEMKPGERPDTIHISNLPIKWFVPHNLTNNTNVKPSEKIFYQVFEKFGSIRCIDIPICDSYRNKMKAEMSGLQTFSFDDEHFFEGYVQYRDYVGFCKAMDSLKAKRLLHKEALQVYTVNLVVNFDKTKHLSAASIRRREIVRDRLMKNDILNEERKLLQQKKEDKKRDAERKKKNEEREAKEQRRREREEKRKTKILTKLKVHSADEINSKIAKEEKKLLKIQRKLEAIRLLEALFQRIKIKNMKQSTTSARNEDEKIKIKDSQLDVNKQQGKLKTVVDCRTILKGILSNKNDNKHFSDSESSNEDQGEKKFENHNVLINNLPGTMKNDWFDYPSGSNLYRCPPPAYSTVAFGRPHYYSHFRNRGGRRFFRGNYRGSFRDKNMLYPPELQEQYYRYFEKFLYACDDRIHHSCSRSKSRSYSHHRTSSSRSRSRSRSISINRKTRSRSLRKRSLHTPRKSSSSRKQSKHHSRAREKSRSPSYKSIDSSKFISPSRFRIPHSRSCSVSSGAGK